MNPIKITVLAILVLVPMITSAASSGPAYVPPTAGVPLPLDRPYPGTLTVSVDATDTRRRIVHVEEELTGVKPDTVLVFPKWVPGNHSTTGAIERHAGLRVTANGTRIAWTRDTLDMYAFHLAVPTGTSKIEIAFDYLSPTSTRIDPVEISQSIAMLEWTALVMYPAGYYARQVPVTASVKLPDGWELASALEPVAATGSTTRFRQVSVEKLVDSPIFAGSHVRRFELAGSASPRVTLNVFAEREDQLAASPSSIEAYRSLVQQGYRLFGPGHFAHYDFLYALSDQLSDKGLEHHESSEDTGDTANFTEWDKTAHERDLLPHEFTHSWNGKFRRPADLWTPNYNVPMRNTLLWAYEGQTEYWSAVLAARSGLWTIDQALDRIALNAAEIELEPGRAWRSLQDTTNDPILNHHRPVAWQDFSRYKDYYVEGSLLWLDADTLIRERSAGRRSLDDFARRFFDPRDSHGSVLTYDFDDLVRSLNAIEPYDWARFLHERLDAVGAAAPLDGLRRGGYRLVYTETPSAFEKNLDEKIKVTDLSHSIGMVIDDKDGSVKRVVWGKSAFDAGITDGAQIIAVNGRAYDGVVLSDAVRAAQKTRQPIELILKTDDHFWVAHIAYFDGLRYPHLERAQGLPARLDEILAARPG